MSGQIDVREYSDYLQVTVSGDEITDFALRYLRQTGDDCKRKGFKKALIVADTKGRLSSGDMNSMVGRISSYIRGLKIALVSGESDDYGREYAEAVSRQSGCDFKAFHSAHQAEAWLGKS